MAYVLTNDGTEIFYRDQGRGRPVVLIHGWPLTGDSWDATANLLIENGLRVIDYDRRGFGRSGQPGYGYDYDTLAADLATLIDKLDLTDVTLVGFSMGGGEVVRYLARYGATRVGRAVLISAVTPYLLKTDENPDGVDSKVFDDVEKGIRKDRFDFFKTFAEQFYGRSALKHTVSQGVLDWFQYMQSSGSTRSILQTAKSWSTTDFRSDVAGITVPLLVIHGTGDKTVPYEASGKRIKGLLPHASVVEFDGEPHGLFMTAPDRLHHELLLFIGGMAEPISTPVLS